MVTRVSESLVTEQSDQSHSDDRMPSTVRSRYRRAAVPDRPISTSDSLVAEIGQLESDGPRQAKF
eukprot:756670-Hanusia_phi.AAC.3